MIGLAWRWLRGYREVHCTILSAEGRGDWTPLDILMSDEDACEVVERHGGRRALERGEVVVRLMILSPGVLFSVYASREARKRARIAPHVGWSVAA